MDILFINIVNASRYIYKTVSINYFMKFLFTTSSRKALKQIKERMIQQYHDKDINKFIIKFTKKKEFIAIPFAYSGPAFQLFLNNKFYKAYFFKEKKWSELD